ncbi:hypothetical protein Tco_1492222 [Tanacetum coccineum]
MDKEDPLKVTQSLAADYNMFIQNLNPDAQPSGVSDRVNPVSSFASVFQTTKKKTVKLTELRNDKVVEGAKVDIPLVAVEEVSSSFANTLYGHFIGGESVIENGPWLIRLVPLFLNIWTPNTVFKKEEVKNAPLWVKLHRVPIVAYSEIRLSLITTQIGRPIMLDSYTSNMCMKSWCRKGYARALIEVSSEKELMESIDYACPKLPKETAPVSVTDNEGFTEVKRKKNKPKQARQVDGIRITKPALNLHYRRVEKGGSFKSQQAGSAKVLKSVDHDVETISVNAASVPNVNSGSLKSASTSKVPEVTLKNSFASLSEDDASAWGDDSTWNNAKQALNVINESDTEEVEELVLEDTNGKRIVGNHGKGASTPGVVVRHVISENNLSVCDILESHMAKSKLQRMCSSVFRHWDWTTNGSFCTKGTRIILGWNHNDVDIVVINLDDQAIHTRIWLKRERKELFCTFVYAHNRYIPRRALWEILTLRCVISTDIEVMDVQRSGLQFTWTQKPKGKDGILKKIDRIMANLVFNDEFVGAHAIFKPFKDIVSEGNLHTNVIRLRDDLDRVQIQLDADPFNSALREEEASIVVAFNEAKIMEEKFLRQKAKVDWLRDGDSNSAYFHKVVKSRVSRSRIDVVTSMDGTVFENEKVADAFVTHYEQFLGQAGAVALSMVRNVTRQEVKDALFSMGNDKAPGPDGFTAAFFKECISKIIANRIKESLKVLISLNQSAFIPGRSISDNILLTQELMHNYHLDHGVPQCAFKVDIQKAYDMVDWAFLREILAGFGFHERMISWIMECVTTSSYSICINGSLHGYFKGQRGLRQCDPLSPYLFTLVMEILTLMLHMRVREDGISTRIIKEALEEFKNASGLTLSLSKSTTYFCNVLNHIKIAILNILPFDEGRLPVKHLGVPLVSSRLLIRDCKELVEKVHARIQDWKNKSLSIAGRLQLIKSVIGFMHTFWASVFIILTRVLLDLEQIMRGFLWCQGSMRKGQAKVAWDVVCLPKKEGGLGLRRLDYFNKALMASHVWNLISLKESLWVQWVHTYKLRGMNFWDLPFRGNMSWGWRKIWQLRSVIREFIWHNIGDGSCTSIWAGLSPFSKLWDILNNGVFSWPSELSSKHFFLLSINMPNARTNRPDLLEWRNETGTVKQFYISSVWNSIRPRSNMVVWFDVVWFSNCIPRHAFNLWLAVKQRLKTQDKLCSWDLSSSLMASCPLCETHIDSHEHLFFECSFSTQI